MTLLAALNSSKYLRTSSYSATVASVEVVVVEVVSVSVPALGREADLCRLPVQFFPSKGIIISTSRGLEIIQDHIGV